METVTTSATSVPSSNSGVINAGNAFKLMIEKRRGRPSKEFREQIEKLKNSDQKVEVEIYPPLSKHSKLPAWLNDLNVDIVNPRRKAKGSAVTNTTSSEGDSIVATGNRELSNVEVVDLVATGNRELGNVEVVDLTNEQQHIQISPNDTSGERADSAVDNYSHKEYTNHTDSPNKQTNDKTYIHNIRRRDEPCEFEIKSVKSLAPPPVSHEQTTSFIHFPYNSSAPPITVPHSVLSYNDYMLDPELRSKKESEHNMDVRNSCYPVNHPYNDNTNGYPQSFALNKNCEENRSHTLRYARNGDGRDRRTSPSKSAISPGYHQVYSPKGKKSRYETSHCHDNPRYGNNVIIHNPIRMNHEHREANHGYPIVYTHHPQYVSHKPTHNEPRDHRNDLVRNNNIPESYRSNRCSMYPEMLPVANTREHIVDEDLQMQRYESVRVLSDQEIVVVPSRSWVSGSEN